METVASNTAVVVDFSAPAWCVPCRRLAPHFMAASQKLPEVKFVEVDIDLAPAIQEKFGVMTVPFVVAFKNGKVVAEVKSRTTIPLIEEVKKILNTFV